MSEKDRGYFVTIKDCILPRRKTSFKIVTLAPSKGKIEAGESQPTFPPNASTMYHG